jgi:hypothetical protein
VFFLKRLVAIALLFVLLTGCSINFKNETRQDDYEAMVKNGKITINYNGDSSQFEIVFYKKEKNKWIPDKWLPISSGAVEPTTKRRNWAISFYTKPYLYFGTIIDPQIEKIMVDNNIAKEAKFNSIRFWYYIDYESTRDLSIYEVTNGKKILIQK